MRLNLPNLLTLSRLILAVVFFALVSSDDPRVLDWAEFVFVIACVTDYFDGYFARKLKLVTALGRIGDPFVDKVIICGGFAMLAGRCVVIAPWMVVVLISREFLVSSIRGYAESRGIAFGAELAGKVKVVVQMVALGSAIYYHAHRTLPFLGPSVSSWVMIASLYLALVLTLVSAITYVTKAWDALRELRQT